MSGAPPVAAVVFPPGLPTAIARDPWFESVRDTAARVLGPGASAVPLAKLDAHASARALRSGNGQPLAFADADTLSYRAYESHIALTGAVPTRTRGRGGLHDLLNALVWLSFPRAKASLNAIQAGVIDRAGVAPSRGSTRDLATLFDENGAMLVTRERWIVDALAHHDWPRLFVRERERFVRGARLYLFGHALMQKLLDPYKAICAHVVALDSDADSTLDSIDAHLAEALPRECRGDTRLMPLPVLGIPGWWPANEDPAFYNDARVFRPAQPGDPRP